MNWQEVLWALPTEMGWIWYAIWGTFGGAAALILFFTVIMNRRFDALLVARALLGIGLLLIPLCVVQSGWQAWVPVFYSLGGFLSAVLIATNWCNRADQSSNIIAALWRWGAAHVNAVVCWLCGPRTHARREDVL